MTPEALVLHFIDDLDAKLNQFRSLRGKGDGPHYLRGLGRYVYAGARGNETMKPSEGEEPTDEQAKLDL